jgi:hypothetical protein
MTCLIQVHDTIHDFPKDTHAALRANGSSVGACPMDACPMDAGSVNAGFVDVGFVDVGFVGAGFVGAGFVGAGFVGAGFVGAGFVDVGFVGAGFVGAGFVDVGSVGAGSEPAPTGARDVIMMVPCTWFGMTTNASHITFGTWLGRSCQVYNPLTFIGTGTWDGIHHHVRRLPVHPYLPSISRISSGVRSYRR